MTSQGEHKEYSEVRSSYPGAIARMNEAAGSAALEVPLSARNLGEQDIKLDRAEASVEVRFFKYFLGPKQIEEWFKYKLSFALDDIKFKDDSGSGAGSPCSCGAPSSGAVIASRASRCRTVTGGGG